jgi:hypothetical protein
MMNDAVKEVYAFRFHATPRKQSAHAERCAGAYINVWVSFPDRNLAQQIARFVLRSDDWRIRRLEGEWISTDDSARSDRTLRLHKQALKYGYSMMIFGYEK